MLSYNIHKGIGGRDRRYRLERIIRVIEDQNPDIICLQEVDRHVARSRHDDQPRKLADALRRGGAPLSAQRAGQGRRIRQPGALALAVPVTPPGLAASQETQAPGRQMAVVETPEGPFHLVHWHLGLAERERHWQVRHLLEHALFRESAHLPTLIVGDFNDWLNTLARGPFARHGFVQVTAPRWRFRSFPAYMPVASLDKAFVRGPVEIRHARIVHSRLARDASDHLPLVVDFHLDRR